MIKYSLKCSKCDFIFDSWFATSLEFDRLKKKNLIYCSECGSHKILKSIMSPSLMGAKENNINKEKNHKEIRKKIIEYQKFIKKNSIYVGDNFAHEARILHYDKKKSKSIYGKATTEEIKDLNEEGIETITVPWIDNFEN